jgi:hypothetical protein
VAVAIIVCLALEYFIARSAFELSIMLTNMAHELFSVEDYPSTGGALVLHGLSCEKFGFVKVELV